MQELELYIKKSLQEIEKRLIDPTMIESYINIYQLRELQLVMREIEDKLKKNSHVAPSTGFKRMILDSWDMRDKNNKLTDYLFKVAKLCEEMKWV